MGVNIKGGNNSVGLANVTGTYELQVTTPQTEANAGFVQLSAEIDAGDVTGTRTTLPLEVSDDYRLRVGLDQTVFNTGFEGATVRTDLWNQSLSTMTVAQASGYFSLNNGNATANGNYAIVTSRRMVPMFGTYPTYVDIWAREANFNASNAISEWGIGFVATTTAPTDGIFFRRNTSGVLKAVVNYAGTETEETIDTTNVPPRSGVGTYDTSECNHFLIVVHNDIANFWINDVLVSSISCPDANPLPTQASAQPIFVRVYNTGVASAARRIELGFINASIGDQNMNKLWSHALSGLGGGSYHTQQGSTTAGTVTRTNGAHGWPASGTARIAGTWTGTSAPALNSLGGLWTSPAVSSIASDTDYPVFAYLNPAGTTLAPGKTLYVTGVRVGEAYVSTGATINPILFSYIVTVNATSATTSTADSTTAISHKATVIGGHGFSATETAGNFKPGFEMRFDTPLIVSPGSYFTFIVRPFGTVTSNTLVVQSSLAVNGYFE